MSSAETEERPEPAMRGLLTGALARSGRIEDIERPAVGQLPGRYIVPLDLAGPGDVVPPGQQYDLVGGGRLRVVAVEPQLDLTVLAIEPGQIDRADQLASLDVDHEGLALHLLRAGDDPGPTAAATEPDAEVEPVGTAFQLDTAVLELVEGACNEARLGTAVESEPRPDENARMDDEQEQCHGPDPVELSPVSLGIFDLTRRARFLEPRRQGPVGIDDEEQCND